MEQDREIGILVRHICYMLHLNKRSCIVTNLIGIQWFTRESIVSRHGGGTGDNEVLNRRYKRKWNAAMNESANWKTLFFSLLFLLQPLKCLFSLRDLVPSTCQRCACRCKKHGFFFSLHGYIYRHSARHRVQFLSRRYHRVLVNCMTSSEITTSTLKAHSQCALYVLLLAFLPIIFLPRLCSVLRLFVLSSEDKKLTSLRKR